MGFESVETRIASFTSKLENTFKESTQVVGKNFKCGGKENYPFLFPVQF